MARLAPRPAGSQMNGRSDRRMLVIFGLAVERALARCLPACLPGWLAGCLCIYGIGTMLPAHTNTNTHTEEVVLRHAAHTVALALGKLWQQAQPGSPSQPVGQACCLLRLLFLLPLLSLVLYFWRAVCQVPQPRCV